MMRERVQSQEQGRQFPFARKPQHLSGGFNVRLAQIEAIAADPTDRQKAVVKHAINRIVDVHYNPGILASSVSVAKFVDRVHYGRQNGGEFLENTARMIQERKEAIDKIEKARKELSTPGGTGSSIREARERLAEARRLKREREHLLYEDDFVLRESRIKVAPEYASLTIFERARFRAYKLQKKVVEPGFEFGRKKLELLVKNGVYSLNSVKKEGHNMLKTAGQGVRSIFSKLWGGIRSIGSSVQNVSRPMVNTVSQQGERIRTVKQQAQTRISGEIGKAVEKGRPFFGPKWESIQRDRTTIKKQTQKAGSILMIKAEEKVSPVIYTTGRKVEETIREKRDKISSFSKEKAGRIRTVGKEALNFAGNKVKRMSEVSSTVREGWKRFQQERVNNPKQEKFSDGILGEAGLILRIASHVEKYESAVRNENAAWWLEDRKHGLKEGVIRTAEWIDKQEEQVTRGIEAVRGYWNEYAVKRWEEMGITKQKIRDRVRLMNAAGAVSLDKASKKIHAVPYEVVRGGKVAGKGVLRGGSFATGATLAALDGASWVGVKAGSELFRLLAEHKKLRRGLALGTPIAVALLANPHMINDISAFFQQGLGGLNLAAATGSGVDLAGNLPSFDAGIVSSGNYSPTVDISSINTADMGNQIFASDPSYHLGANIDTGTGGIINAPAGSGEVTVFDSSSVNVGADTLSTSDGMNSSVSGIITAPDVSSVNITELVTKIQPGQPVGAQIAELARGMPGDVDDNILKLMHKTFEVSGWNFESTSRAIVNGEGGPYTQGQITIAKKALEAINAIKNDPSSISLEQLEKAMYYWRPVPR